MHRVCGLPPFLRRRWGFQDGESDEVMTPQTALVLFGNVPDFCLQVAGRSHGIDLVISHFNPVADLQVLQDIGTFLGEDAHAVRGQIPYFELIKKGDVPYGKFNAVVLVNDASSL